MVEGPGPGYDLWNSDHSGSGAARPFKKQYRGMSDGSHGSGLMSGRKPTILQFASDGVVGRQHTCDVDKFDGDLHTLIRLCGRDPARIGAPVAGVVVADKGTFGGTAQWDAVRDQCRDSASVRSPTYIVTSDIASVSDCRGKSEPSAANSLLIARFPSA